MKFITVVTVVTAAAGSAFASPHKQHAHNHQRRGENVVTIYELNGEVISAADVQRGIANGTLVFHNGAVAAPQAAAASPVVKPQVQAAAVEPQHHHRKHRTTSVMQVAPTSAPVSSQPPSSSTGSSNAASMSGSGMNNPFPDGQLSCSQFPSAYGALAIPWMGLGGWSGIQSPGSSAAGTIDNIMTKVSGDSCSEGDYCSYACPPGYQKSQWPTAQGATGQSVGGLLCQGGKLHLTNPGLSRTICMKGAQQVNVQVRNTMSQVASVCRTDYPGTESEVIPLSATPGSTTPLTCPDGNNYYQWQGKMTSAQYYVNPKGVPVQEACKWGSPGTPTGNYAPLNLGVGYSAGAAWLSIFQNQPTTNDKLDYTVELVGDNGGFSNFVGRCRYSHGQYCSGDSYENCSSNGAGCTVNVQHGTATFVFSD